jgi:DNA-binding response OmpR family regulator
VSVSLNGLRVLVVEDEMLVSMLVEDMLTDFGCSVVGPAPDFDEAMSLASTADIDAALLDVNVAGKAVFPVADALKARGVPFAFASGYGAAGVEGEHAGAPVLQKPFRQSDLERALNGLMATAA